MQPASATAQPALFRAALYCCVHVTHVGQGKAGQARKVAPQSFSNTAAHPLKASRCLVHWLWQSARLVALTVVIGEPIGVHGPASAW